MQNINDRMALSSVVSAISRAKVEYKLNIIVDYSFASDIMNIYRKYFAEKKDIHYSLFDDLGIFRSILHNELVSNSLGLLVSRISCICDLPDDNYYDYIEKNRKASKYADDCYALLLKYLKITKEIEEKNDNNSYVIIEDQPVVNEEENHEFEIEVKPLEDINLGRVIPKRPRVNDAEVIYASEEGRALKKIIN